MESLEHARRVAQRRATKENRPVTILRLPSGEYLAKQANDPASPWLQDWEIVEVVQPKRSALL